MMLSKLAAAVFATALVAAPALAADHPKVEMSAGEAHAHAQAKHGDQQKHHETDVRMHNALKEICGAAKLAGEKVSMAACDKHMAHHTQDVVDHTKAQTQHDIGAAHHGAHHGKGAAPSPHHH